MRSIDPSTEIETPKTFDPARRFIRARPPSATLHNSLHESYTVAPYRADNFPSGACASPRIPAPSLDTAACHDVVQPPAVTFPSRVLRTQIFLLFLHKRSPAGGKVTADATRAAAPARGCERGLGAAANPTQSLSRSAFAPCFSFPLPQPKVLNLIPPLSFRSRFQVQGHLLLRRRGRASAQVR